MAQPHMVCFFQIECLSTTGSEDYVATSTEHGNIVVWNLKRKMKVRPNKKNMPGSAYLTYMNWASDKRVKFKKNVSKPKFEATLLSTHG